MFYKSILELLALAGLFFDFEEEKYKKKYSPNPFWSIQQATFFSILGTQKFSICQLVFY